MGTCDGETLIDQNVSSRRRRHAYPTEVMSEIELGWRRSLTEVTAIDPEQAASAQRR
jgi:hypothetical protein